LDIGEATKREVHAPAGLEAHPERPDDWVDQEDAQQDERWRDKEPPADVLSSDDPCYHRRTCPVPTQAHANQTRPDNAGPGQGVEAGFLPLPSSPYWIACFA